MKKIDILALALVTSLTPAAALAADDPPQSGFTKPDKPNAEQASRQIDQRGYLQPDNQERSDNGYSDYSRRDDRQGNRNGDDDIYTNRDRDGRRYGREDDRGYRNDDRYNRYNGDRGYRGGDYRNEQRSNDNRRYNNRWHHNWRNNDRYNWRDYRGRYGNEYRIGRYDAPYRGRYYSRLSVGGYMGSLYYDSRYWINDPYRYRLPNAYGSYRWVRYYNDVVLVDIYNGCVVDIIHSFFY